jgi:hypothetical protein
MCVVVYVPGKCARRARPTRQQRVRGARCAEQNGEKPASLIHGTTALKPKIKSKCREFSLIGI